MPEFVLDILDEMFTFGCSIERERLRRDHPTADDAEIELLLRSWLAHRPGAEHGDAVGRPCTLPRT